MESCTISGIREIEGDEDAASRVLELVGAARAGSNAAFEELRRRYSSCKRPVFPSGLIAACRMSLRAWESEGLVCGGQLQISGGLSS